MAQWDAVLTAGGVALTGTRFSTAMLRAVDWPACNYYRELMTLYPEAKVILSRRSDAATGSRRPRQRSSATGMMRSPPFTRRVIADIVGPDRHDRDAVIAAYERHNAEVIATVPAERLLVYTAGDGWGPLCAFLGCRNPTRPIRARQLRPASSRR